MVGARPHRVPDASLQQPTLFASLQQPTQEPQKVLELEAQVRALQEKVTTLTTEKDASGGTGILTKVLTKGGYNFGQTCSIAKKQPVQTLCLDLSRPQLVNTNSMSNTRVFLYR